MDCRGLSINESLYASDSTGYLSDPGRQLHFIPRVFFLLLIIPSMTCAFATAHQTGSIRFTTNRTSKAFPQTMFLRLCYSPELSDKPIHLFGITIGRESLNAFVMVSIIDKESKPYTFKI